MNLSREIGIKGMHCAACSARIEKVAGAMSGVDAVAVNLAGAAMALSSVSVVSNALRLRYFEPS